jgi:hypothetical protein
MKVSRQNKMTNTDVGFAVLTTLGMKSIDLWVVTTLWKNISSPSSGWKTKRSQKQAETCGKIIIFSCLFFQYEDGGDMSLRNVSLSSNYMVLQTRTPYSSLGLMLVRENGEHVCGWKQLKIIFSGELIVSAALNTGVLLAQC